MTAITETARLRLVAQGTLDIARRALNTALACTPHLDFARIGYLRGQVRRAEQAIADLDGLTIPPVPDVVEAARDCGHTEPTNPDAAA